MYKIQFGLLHRSQLPENSQKKVSQEPRVLPESSASSWELSSYTPDTRKLLELEKQLQDIKASMETSPSSPSQHGQSQPEISDDANPSEEPGGQDLGTTSLHPIFNPQQVGGVELSAQAISDIIDW